ncbi:hypothetical protein H0H81_008797 [Sphagnurus paluster]|uniref:F-box domain-containing protein n=1 Tax=Sphagnurus paluster TaxID=117069 RepID=A0A9P7FYG3_9AGAR|nr:hypothetical protein H0H81_008797 [Sphagnurus paluster]
MDYGGPSKVEDSILHPFDHPPYLLLLGNEEADAQQWENELRARGELDTDREGDHVTFYRNLRVFLSIKGFYEGDLDLAGRNWSRLADLLKRVCDYLPDFYSVCTLAKEFTTNEKDSRGIFYIDYEFSDEGVQWENFRKKWNISSHYSFGVFRQHTLEIRDYLQETPKIQKLYLCDLPPEILDRVNQLATIEQARLLSSTCRQLNEVGRRYIFRTRSLTFELPLSLFCEASEADREQALLSCYERLLSTCNFLLEHPELLDKLLHLKISASEIQFLDGMRLTQVYQAFSDVLSSCLSLTTLTIHSLELTSQLSHLISSLPSLKTLELRDCPLSDDFEALFSSGGTFAEWKSVYNLKLGMSTNARKRLPDNALSIILHILTERDAPLEVLVLEGLGEAEYTLFEQISHSFPGLIALTLIRRASPRQTRNLTITWPNSSWEYAKHLEGLTQLKHFRWNSDDSTSWSSAPLRRFEEGFHDKKTNTSSSLSKP